MGARLKRLREEAGVNVSELARRADADRSYVHEIESGRANPTIELYAKLLSICGVDFEEFLAGMQTSSVPAHQQELHRMLSVILNSNNSDLLHGIRINLEAISEKAARLQKARASPRPALREGTEGTQAKERQTKKRKVS